MIGCRDETVLKEDSEELGINVNPKDLVHIVSTQQSRVLNEGEKLNGSMNYSMMCRILC